MSPHSHAAAGIAITVVSAILYNLGFVLEKRALADMPSVHARRLRHLVGQLVTSPRWVLGFASMLAGLALQIVALSLLAVSVVQPIFVSGIVLLLLLSHISLGERLGRSEWAGVALVAVALLCMSLSLDPGADRAGTRGTALDIVAAGAPTVVAALWIFFAADRFGDRPGRRPHLGAPLYGMAAGLVYGVAALATKAVSAEVTRDGIVGGIPHVLGSADLYILAAASAGGLLLFQTALQRCHASVVVPVSNVISSTYLILLGTILFGDHLPPQPWRLALRAAGFVGVLGGMALLAGARSLVTAYGPAPVYPEAVAVEEEEEEPEETVSP